MPGRYPFHAGDAQLSYQVNELWKAAQAGGTYATYVILASVTAGNGASLIGVEDAGGLLTATTVEDALAEIAAEVDTNTGDIGTLNAAVSGILADYLTSASIGVTVQGYAANLDTWAGVASSADGRALVAAANYAAMRGLLDLEAGTDFYSIAAADAAFATAAQGALADSALQNVIEDTSPTLGGNFDAGGFSITNVGVLTVGGAFTSLGIDDNATREVLQLADTVSLFNTAGTGSYVVSIRGAAATSRSLQFQTGSLTRWGIGADGSAESGGDVGSDFRIFRADDAGAFIENVFKIERHNGLGSWTSDWDVGGDITVGGTVDGRDVAADGVLLDAVITDLLSKENSENLLYGAWFATAPWQRGTSFTAATTPANSDDTYLLDMWVLISDGNDIVDLSQDTDGSLLATVQTANKQFGFVQIVEAVNCAHIIGATVSIAARLKASGLATFRMAVLSWTGTADTVTSDVVGTWAGGGTEPTWATNWTREGAILDITTTGSFATSKGEDISIDTASTKQIAIVIWLDDTDGAGADTVNIEWLSCVAGALHPDRPRFRTAAEELDLCQRYYERYEDNTDDTYIGVGYASGTDDAFILWRFRVRKRADNPTISGGGAFGVEESNAAGGSSFWTGFDFNGGGTVSYNMTEIKLNHPTGTSLVDAEAVLGYCRGNTGYIEASSEL